VARLVELFRGNRAYFHGATTRQRNSRGGTAQVVDRAVRPVGPRQDVVAARRPGAALARVGILSRLRPHRLCAGVAVAGRPDQAGDLPRDGRGRLLDTRGSAVEGESLWEFLHHRGDLLRDASEQTLLPLLIFDQFEEIFTLAQADDAAGNAQSASSTSWPTWSRTGRRPSSNDASSTTRPMPTISISRGRLPHPDLAARGLPAHLESVKGTMPSITQNRMRLAA